MPVTRPMAGRAQGPTNGGHGGGDVDNDGDVGGKQHRTVCGMEQDRLTGIQASTCVQATLTF